MKIESPNFTAADLDAFMDELIDSDRLELADRLERASGRLAEAVARLRDPDARPDPAAWTAREIVAHVAVLSKFYGMLTYKIGRGELAEIDLAGQVGQRDVLGERLAQLPIAELLALAQADHRRTAAYLRSADAEAMKRACRTGRDRSLSAGEVARFALCAHLEQHVRQLEAGF